MNVFHHPKKLSHVVSNSGQVELTAARVMQLLPNKCSRFWHRDPIDQRSIQNYLFASLTETKSIRV